MKKTITLKGLHGNIFTTKVKILGNKISWSSKKRLRNLRKVISNEQKK